jgi:2-dehydro-3-deoxyglucarate aldolase/4-hydroxy-2-oxoheptanedioate aldolase
MIEDLKQKFLNRQSIKGAMIFDFFAPGMPYVIKNSGCEFVIYDMEHGGLTLDKFKELSLISKGIALSPMIRIPEINYNYIARSLDLGANGIMIPMVNDKREALEIVKCSKYPPLGKRGAGFGFAHNEYKKENPIDIMKYANKTLINIIQIENKRGLENVEEIAKIDGVDCLWVGHFDLSNFLGVPGQFNSKLYLDAINKIVKAGKKYQKSLGIMVSTKQEMFFYSDLGFNVIAVGTEMFLLQDKISDLIK